MEMRNLVPPKKESDTPLGQQFPNKPSFLVRDPSGTAQKCMRSTTSRVLNIDPDSKDGLIKVLLNRNNEFSEPKIETLGPGDFALQMVKSPEAIKFTCQS